MQGLYQLIKVCPLCKKEDLKSDGDASDIVCGSCGSRFEVTSDHRQATLKMTLTDSPLPGWRKGTTLLSVPNMNLVERNIEELHGQ